MTTTENLKNRVMDALADHTNFHVSHQVDTEGIEEEEVNHRRMCRAFVAWRGHEDDATLSRELKECLDVLDRFHQAAGTRSPQPA